ncbi:hypothetical protein OKA04_05880 [Luteolibacter flavescens]|uniref:Uncharacterized protein n=1 Tax=Luteolibacter flavescens TaxID=1859460 RepID=A0ABT3FL05_9BACT|nr:hypothetical protein [Luteolibacter flavescens]MCW1884252.1 hypothetical protein [Luteolibacter flavescens]
MKSTLILLALASVAAAAPRMTDRVTPEEILARQKPSPLSAIPQPAAPDEAPVVRPGEQSLIKKSEVLSDGTHWTIVPKGAVLHTPPAFAAKVGAKPIGTLLSWSEFLTANRAWLNTEEVSFDNAAGKTALPPAKQENWQKQAKVVVAVHLGGPISVRPQPQPEAPVAATR